MAVTDLGDFDRDELNLIDGWVFVETDSGELWLKTPQSTGWEKMRDERNKAQIETTAD